MVSSMMDAETSFYETFQAECLIGSAIDRLLFQSSIQLVPDTLTLPGGEVSFPIHEGLNWQVTRFGHSARATQHAALFVNEDASVWQAKLEFPITDKKKGKPRKYETPKGNGSRVFLPEVPTEIRQRIGDRYQVKVPLCGSFWEWLEQNPQVPMVATEGGKKGLALLTQGFVPLTLYGVNGGYRSKDRDGNRVRSYLTKDVARFAVPGRMLVMAFDQDEKPKTRRTVHRAINTFSWLLERAGASVAIAAWDRQDGKGVDDLIANQGKGAFEKAYAEAQPVSHWRIAHTLSQQLTFAANLELVTDDLSTLRFKDLPDDGIVAIASPKGTGKTKFISSLLSDVKKVVAATHRVSLAHNLAERLVLGVRNDMLRFNGRYVDREGYAERIALCVDSLLALPVEMLEQCDLVIDEVNQVVKHLLLSPTCSKDGRRPALLSRLRLALERCHRVIIADADLNDDVIRYIQTLRGEDSIFLIRNRVKKEGYPVRFIACDDRTAIITELLEEVNHLKLGEKLFVCTDSKSYSKTLAGFLGRYAPDKKILVINSETSGGEAERAFLKNPDREIEHYDVVISSPSMTTGVSLEIKGSIKKVYGIFGGVSLDDADMAQMLGRVREPVERVVWCSQIGSNRSDVSLSTNPLIVKSHLMEKTSVTVQLLRSSLREDSVQCVEAYDWQSDPHVNHVARLIAQQNASMLHLRDALLVRLQWEGNRVTVEQEESQEETRILLQLARKRIKAAERQAILTAPDYSLAQVLELELKDTLTPEEQHGLIKHRIKQFYVVEEVTESLLILDDEGRLRQEIYNAEGILHREMARHSTERSIDRQSPWCRGVCPWDFSDRFLKSELRCKLKLDELVEKLERGDTWTPYDLKPYADLARTFAKAIAQVLHFTIHEGVSDTQIVHQLLRRCGVRVKHLGQSRQVPGYEGTRVRLYGLDTEHWQFVSTVIARRFARFQRDHDAESDDGTPPKNNILLKEGVPVKLEGFVALLEETTQFGEAATQAIWADVPLDERLNLIRFLSPPLQQRLAA